MLALGAPLGAGGMGEVYRPLQSSRKPLQCQAMTVSGLRMSSADRQSFHRRESQTQRTRSVQARRGLWPQHWRGKATRRCFADAMISTRTEFLIGAVVYPLSRALRKKQRLDAQ